MLISEARCSHWRALLLLNRECKTGESRGKSYSAAIGICVSASL